MTEYNTKETENFRTALLEGLEEKIREGSPENYIQYSDVSRAFPGEPHEHSFEIKTINQKALKKWCSEYGFEVSFLRENVDPKYLEIGMPPLLFRKIAKA